MQKLREYDVLHDTRGNAWVYTERIPDVENSHPIGHSISHPSYYTDGKIEVWDFIEDWDLGYFLGNAVKYISRAGKKSEDTRIEDLEKAKCYINKQLAIWRKADVILNKASGEIGPYEYGDDKSLTMALATTIGMICHSNTGSYKRRLGLLDKALNLINSQIRIWEDEDRCTVETQKE